MNSRSSIRTRDAAAGPRSVLASRSSTACGAIHWSSSRVALVTPGPLRSGSTRPIAARSRRAVVVTTNRPSRMTHSTVVSVRFSTWSPVSIRSMS